MNHKEGDGSSPNDLPADCIDYRAGLLAGAARGICRLRRSGLHLRPARAGGIDLDGNPMGVHHVARQQLASTDLAFAHAGRELVRAESRRAAFGQRSLSRRQHAPAFLVPVSRDEKNVARGVRGGVVRVASTARGIGRLGFRTQRRSQHIFRPARAYRLCELCD